MATDQLSGFPAAVQYPCMPSNLNEIALVPYAKVGDEWTLSDDAVLSIALGAQAQGVLAEIFFDGSVRNPSEFLEMMKNPENIPVFAFAGDKCIGAAWLNGCSANIAFGHFFFLRGGRGEIARKAGKLILDYWRAFKVNEKPLFDVILGVVPSVNWRATRYVQDIGFVRLGEIPKMLRGKQATIFYLTG